MINNSGITSSESAEAYAQQLLEAFDQSIEDWILSSSPTPRLGATDDRSSSSIQRSSTPPSTTQVSNHSHVHSPQAIYHTPLRRTILATEGSSAGDFGLGFAPADVSSPNSHTLPHAYPPSESPVIPASHVDLGPNFFFANGSALLEQRQNTASPRSTNSASSTHSGPVRGAPPFTPSFDHTDESLFGAASLLQPIVPPSTSAPPGPLVPPRPGHGSLAVMRRTITPSPVGPLIAAVYIGFPLEVHPAYKGFFEPSVSLRSSTPSMSALITALRNGNNMLSGYLNQVCSNLDSNPFCIAWSKTMVETNKEFNLYENGYFALGLLRDHLNSSTLVPRASHNSVSIRTFEHFNISQERSFFVLYCFPQHLEHEVEPRADLPSPTPFVLPSSRTQTPALAGHTTRSHTPAATSSFSQFLSALRSNCTFLDRHFIAEASRLVKLGSAGYNTAYLHIRQVLIIQDVDVAAWARIPPNTYSNNLTFASNARVLLQYLRERTTAERQALSQDLGEKEDGLIQFFGHFFRVEEIPDDWREAQSEVRTVGGINQADVKRIVEGYNIPPQQHRSLSAQLMTYC
ncbi:hypothetical protein R3P38DRAFT_3522187 [Favolaschia claudopus]|uniref:Uncharacterized protein n=1 Tax=Favolaschia claudopus TaxID=2862362 RepID=A0AAW0E5A6_9AGAR